MGTDAEGKSSSAGFFDESVEAIVARLAQGEDEAESVWLARQKAFREGLVQTRSTRPTEDGRLSLISKKPKAESAEA